jgi:predicted MPP superfamily phosphohydrolase
VIRTFERQLPVPFLPEKLRGLRLVHLTDIHYGRTTPNSLITQAVAAANAVRPDVIVITGDFVSGGTDDPHNCAKLLADLEAPLGVYGSLGNHDYAAGAKKVTKAVESVGIEMLINRNVEICEGLFLAGFDDDRYGKPNPEAAFQGIDPCAAVIALIHNPAYAEHIHGRRYVGLCGHTHGGQVLLPFLTARELRRIGAKHYRVGWYNIGGSQVYVSYGVGYSGMRVRFLCPSEVTAFTLEPAL